MDVLAEGEWQKFFKVKPDVFTAEEKRAWLDKNTDVALGSDAFFPFGDNIERAHKSGVKYVAQPGGSVRDDHVIDTCNKYGMVMSFTGIRLFHHKSQGIAVIKLNLSTISNSIIEDFMI